MFHKILQKMTSNPQTRALEDSSPAPEVNPNLSPFEELAVSLKEDMGSLSDAKQVEWWRANGKFEKLVAKGARLYELMIAGPTETTESRFTAVQDLHRWGYAEDK